MGPIGFPWHQLALTVTALPVLVQTADLAGAGGLGFIVATINVLLAMAWWTRYRRTVALAHVEVAATVLFLVTLYGLHRLNTLPLEPGAIVAVVQPNVTVHEKWTPSGQDAIVRADGTPRGTGHRRRPSRIHRVGPKPPCPMPSGRTPGGPPASPSWRGAHGARS